jgi:recombination protein RecA
MKTKFNKESRNLIIGMLLGDGTISNNYVFKLSHGEKQKEYLEWKIKLLNEYGIKNNGLKEYIQKIGYNIGSKVYYSQLSIIPFIKVLRRVIYNPKKNYANRKLLNRLNALAIAIWYMDDGHINIRKTKNKVHGFYIKIATCLAKEQNQIIIDYFKEVWNISFYQFKEGKETYSLCCGTQEGVKFIQLIKPYIESCPSMIYKIQYDLSQRKDYVA